MAEVDFSGWLARKYDIMQQNANTNAAEVEQRGAAATMQYGVGGAYDRSEAAATKRKKMELDQQAFEFNSELPLKQKEVAAKVGLYGAQAGNLYSETNYNKAMLPLYTEAQRYENTARKRGLEGSSTFEELKNPNANIPSIALPRETYLSTDGGGRDIDVDYRTPEQKRFRPWR